MVKSYVKPPSTNCKFDILLVTSYFLPPIIVSLFPTFATANDSNKLVKTPAFAILVSISGYFAIASALSLSYLAHTDASAFEAGNAGINPLALVLRIEAYRSPAIVNFSK